MSKPAAVIITLEDSASWLDQRLILAYLHTTYRVRTPTFDLRIGQSNPVFDLWLAENKVHQFAFITAWNPQSQSLSMEENTRRNQELEKEFYLISIKILPGLGIGDDSDWPPEASCCALNISPEQAVALGRKFDQNALVFGRKGEVPALWWVAEK